MRFFAMLFIRILTLGLLIGSCRIISMTFKTLNKSITIKNDRLAAILIAYKNTWGITTSADKRNKMSLPGMFSYIILFPEIIFLIYDCWICITTDAIGRCPSSKTYITITAWYYLIAISIKLKEAQKFNKGEIW
ncbi:MAG: hypothetical protein K2N63_00805 [Lachnospiraceae bacterium]|nr:hypothetical protein [Lachnospiraceae bacterium]